MTDVVKEPNEAHKQKWYDRLVQKYPLLEKQWFITLAAILITELLHCINWQCVIWFLQYFSY